MAMLFLEQSSQGLELDHQGGDLGFHSAGVGKGNTARRDV